jgi:hypothetical protein
MRTEGAKKYIANKFMNFLAATGPTEEDILNFEDA